MASSSDKRFRNVSYAFLGVGVALLIAGIVMLVIGIINANKTTDCSTTNAPNSTPLPTPNSACSGNNLNPFTITAFTASVPWQDALNNQTTPQYQAVVKNLTDQINAVFTRHSTGDGNRFLVMATNASSLDVLAKLTISLIVQPPQVGGTPPPSGIVFYATLVFVGMPAPNGQQIQDVLATAGITAIAYSSGSSGQCLTYKPPVYPTSPPPTGTPPTGTPPTGPSQPTGTPASTTTVACPTPTFSPRPPFTNCDPTMSNTNVIFLIDGASPTEPGIASITKRQLIVNYLQSFFPSTTTDSWSGLKMGVAIYYGTTAYMVDNYLCNSSSCWTDTLNKTIIQSQISSVSAYSSHNVSAGLLFAVNEFSLIFGLNDPYGTARVAVIVTDGYDYNAGGFDPAPGLAATLKNAGFKLAAVVATPSVSVQSSIKALVSVSWSDSFPLNSITQLNNPTLLTYTANWICSALPLTTPAPPATTITYTLPQLTTTPTPPTTPGPTQPPTAVPGPCQHLDMLFLIDESQSMHISNGFEYATNFISNVVDAYKIIPDARYAWIAFNSKIWVQTPFMNPTDFKLNVSGTRFNEGDTNFVLGFKAAVQTVTNYSNSTRTPVLIFVSDGYPNDGGDLNDISAITKIMRCQLNTIIIGLGINEGVQGANNMRQAIGVGASDNCLPSYYDDIVNYDNITAVGLPQVEQDLHCFQTSPCNLDVMFVFENSELVDYAGRKLELGAMIQTLADLDSNNRLNYYGDHVGIVFFSARDNFNGAENMRSGILDDPANSNSASSTLSQAEALLENFEAQYQLGGASDILLGLNMTSILLSKRQLVDKTNNIPAIVILGRGTFHDGDNCCDSPVAFAQSLRTQYGAQMKGVLVGHLADGNIMTSITGTSNIVPTQNYYTDGFPFNDGVALALQITSWLESVRSNSTCPIPPQLPYCPYFMEIVLVWRYSRRNETFTAIQNFIMKKLLAPGTGSFAGAEQNTVNDRLTRIALVMYDSQTAYSIFNFTRYQYMSDYASAIGSLKWPGPESLRPDLLSEALSEAQEVLLFSARQYASRSVIIFSDEFSRDDLTDSITQYNLLKQLYAGVFGIYVGQRQEDIDDYRQFTDQQITLASGDGLDPSKPPATMVANALHDFVCAGKLPQPTVPPKTTTQAPCTNPPPPTSPQPTKAPAGAWPDITILLDTTANLATGALALNDRGFEAVRMFLVNTLQQYRVDVNHTRVSLVTFDGDVKIVFTFNQNTNMASLMNAIGNQWEYGPSGSHTTDRKLNTALQTLIHSIYNEHSPSGYNPNHINYLWVLVTGLATDGSGYLQSLAQLQAMGIRTQAIGLGKMDQTYLSRFGADSFDYDAPFDPLYGIASPNSPLPRILYQQTTVFSVPPPTLAQIVADFVIVIEESTQLTSTHFLDVQGFLLQFFTILQIGPTGSSVALFSYSDKANVGWPLNQGNNQQAVLDATSKLSYQNNTVVAPNITAALIALDTYYLTTATGYQNRSTFVIFLTSSQTVYPAINSTALPVRNKANVFAIDIGGNYTIPSYFEQLTGDLDHNGFTVGGPAALQNWINKPLINGTNPMNSFFRQMSFYQERYVTSHPIPLAQIAADFIIAIDQTILTQANFQSIQSYLINLFSNFTIGPQFAQVGVITYSGSVIAGDGFPLYSIGNYKQLVMAINNLTWTNNTGTTTADIAAAYHYISNTMLTPGQGWRYGKAFVIVLSSAQNSTLYNGTFNDAEIQKLDSMAHTYGISLFGLGLGAQGFLTHYCNNTASAKSPSQLTTDSPASQNMVAAVDAYYKNDRYPPPPPLSAVQADFVFVIDQASEMNNIDFAAVKSFLLGFVSQLGLNNIGINGSQLAVVSYNSHGIVAATQSSFSLNNYMNGAALQDAINNLQLAQSFQMDSDIANAISFVNNYALTEAQGRRWWKPAFVTFIAIAHNLTNPLNQSQIDILNANSQTFAFDYFNDENAFQYLTQVVGNYELVEKISDFTFTSVEVQNYVGFVEFVWRDWSNTNSKRR